MTTDNQLNSLIKDSITVARSYVFPQEIPKSPNSLKLHKWYKNEVTTISEQLNLLEQKHHCSCTCSKGCSACCRQLITITHLEYLIIESALNKLQSDERASLKAIVEEQCEFLTKRGYSEQSLLSNFISDNKMLAIQDEFFSFQLPCPLLTPDRICSIYSVRPTLCWSYRNYGSPTQCDQAWELPTTIKYDAWEARITERLYQIKRPNYKNSLFILQFALFTMLTKKRF